MNINFKQTFNKSMVAIKKGYTEKAKPILEKGLKYTKDLAKDTVEFAKKNPKKVIGYSALSLLGLSILNVAVKAVKANKVKNEHIAHQREVINFLKDDIEQRQVVIEAQHEALEAAHNKMNNTKEAE